MTIKDCPLCLLDGGECLFRGEHLRVIAPLEDEFPGLIRVIWHQHIAEMTDLTLPERNLLMQTVYEVEDIVRQIMQPDKMNLAAFGNMVPHMHWHIIPRWQNDSYFPQPIWGEKQREEIELLHDWRKKLEKKLMHALVDHFKQSPPALITVTR